VGGGDFLDVRVKIIQFVAKGFDELFVGGFPSQLICEFLKLCFYFLLSFS